MKLISFILSKLFTIEMLAQALKRNPHVISVTILYSDDILDMAASFREREKAHIQELVH